MDFFPDDIVDLAAADWVPDGWHLDVVPEPHEVRHGKRRLRVLVIRAGRAFLEACGQVAPPW